MEKPKALQIARREWDNIRVSLERCGDIGEFDTRDYPSAGFFLSSEDSLLIRNLMEMDKKLSTYGYTTPEATYVFAALASRSGERLRLIGSMAQTFGRTYSWFRTGYPLSDGTERRILNRMDIFDLFFPFILNLAWDFDSPAVKIGLKTVFNRFLEWQYSRSNIGIETEWNNIRE